MQLMGVALKYRNRLINSLMVNGDISHVQAKNKIVHSYANVVKKASHVESCPPVTNTTSKSQTLVATKGGWYIF